MSVSNMDYAIEIPDFNPTKCSRIVLDMYAKEQQLRMLPDNATSDSCPVLCPRHLNLEGSYQIAFEES